MDASVNHTYMLRGFLSSSIAGVLIFAELLYLVIFGLNSVFSIISKALMLSIYAVAFPAYINYSMSNLPKKFLMAYLIPIALVIEAFGLYYLFMGNFLGVYLIVGGYFFEPIAGISLFYAIKDDMLEYAWAFIIGAFIYTFGLTLFPLGLGIIPLLADGEKLIVTFFIVRKLF